MQKFHIISCHVIWRELCYFAAMSRNVFTFHFLQQGLHNTPDKLRQDLQQEIDRVQGDYSAILVGYGLCSNGLVGIKARTTRLVIMRAHDCITFFLGSKKRYQEYFDRYPGTYWYSPGWIDTTEMPGEARYRKAYQDYLEKYGKDNAEYLVEIEQAWIKKYSRAAYVDLGFADTENYKRFARECADWLGWEYDVVPGESKLLVDFLEGNWNSEDFLVVEPGQMVVASHDQQVITVSPCS